MNSLRSNTLRRAASILLIVFLAQLGVGQGLHVAHVFSAESVDHHAAKQFTQPGQSAHDHAGMDSCPYCAGGPVSAIGTFALTWESVSTPVRFAPSRDVDRPFVAPPVCASPRAPPSRS